MALMKSFEFAISGLINALINEHNFRVQWFIALAVFLVASLVDFADWQDTTIVILVFLVLAIELLNSAIEKACDSFGLETSALKKSAKDFAASSVLLVSTAAAFVFLAFISHFVPDAVAEISASPLPWLCIAMIIVFNLPLALYRNHSVFAHALFVASLGITGLSIAVAHHEAMFAVLACVFHVVMGIAYAKRLVEIKKGVAKAVV